MKRRYWVYILANTFSTIYVGVTNNLSARVLEPKEGRGSKFTKRYEINRLVYCHEFGEIRDAIAAEKRIKGWKREKKVALIEEANPTWKDLSSDLVHLASQSTRTWR